MFPGFIMAVDFMDFYKCIEREFSAKNVLCKMSGTFRVDRSGSNGRMLRRAFIYCCIGNEVL
jgi:hypothetical protein